MELAYPFVIYISIPILIFIIILKRKRKIETYKKGRKIANTKYAKSIPYYQNIIKKYKRLSTIMKGVCILCILLSIILIARPVKIETSESIMYNRDIFLCLDVSSSVDELNAELVDTLKDVVDNLKGERFGITIFNTSSVLLVPLTDDYEYINSILDELHESFNWKNRSNNSDIIYLTKYLLTGTLVGVDERGSSLIGDGLASCLYSFTDFNDDRTRIVIFSTDNELEGTEIVTLQEAAKIAKEKNITVYGISPETIKTSDKASLKRAVETTGGEYYSKTSNTTVKSIVKNIENTQQTLMKGEKQTKMTDMPQIPFIMLVVSVFILIILNKKVNL